ncbi:MAG: LCP family protein [Endomicrobiales bacterium]|nr:LCP family protein [Endomicrobiales bacterium]
MKKFKLKLDHVLLITIVAATFAALALSWMSPVARAVRKGEQINGVLIGTDWVDYARHSDTLVLVNYDPSKRFANVISIPRDTRFTPEGYNFRKINEVYAYHYRTKKNDRLAAQEVQRAVEELFQKRIAVPYYIQIDYSAFRKLIDLMGGINIEVDEPMHYDDNAGNLHIHFEPGRHHMNGKQALEYVRFRGRSGDIGRVYRQQKFFKASLSRFKNPYLLFRFPQIINIALKDIQTNLSFWDMLNCMLELKDIQAKDVRLAQIPGTPKRDYWVIDQENCTGFLDKIFVSISSTTINTSPRIRVEVWNASGKSRLAENVTWLLRKQGFDVIQYGTFQVRQKKSLIKDLTGDLRSAQKISELLECGEVITRYDEKRFIDISVILGEDCGIKPDRL